MYIQSSFLKPDIIVAKPSCQTPHPNEDPKDQFGFWVTLKSKLLVPIRIKINEDEDHIIDPNYVWSIQK